MCSSDLVRNTPRRSVSGKLTRARVLDEFDRGTPTASVDGPSDAMLPLLALEYSRGRRVKDRIGVRQVRDFVAKTLV